jgi:diguanylate cyclase (GGDEF)-like protein
MRASLLQELEQADQLPSPPSVALRIVELNRDDQVDITELTRILSEDPALVAKLLKTANSSMFGLPREISSIRHAVLILGLRSVNLLALSFSILSISNPKADSKFDYSQFWTRTIATALGMRHLAGRFLPSLTDEAFLTGMLAGFGQLVLAEHLAERYCKVLQQWLSSGGSLREIEREEFGSSSPELGADLLATWGLPSRVCGTIRDHDEPETGEHEAGADRRLVELLHFSAICGDLLAGGDVLSGTAALEQAGARYLDFDRPDCCEVLLEIQQRLPDLALGLDLTTRDRESLVQIATQAAQLLVRESLALNEQVRNVTSDMDELEQEKSDLELRAISDSLTGLRNRGFFDERLQVEFERACQSGTPLGLLLLDLDYFKSVNDDHGHQAGDEMLREIARAIQDSVEAGDEACRYGGEEFAVICPGATPEGLEARMERLREKIFATEIEASGESVRCSVSIGACTCECATAVGSASTLVAAADRALYSAKAAGRNCGRLVKLD